MRSDSKCIVACFHFRADDHLARFFRRFEGAWRVTVIAWPRLASTKTDGSSGRQGNADRPDRAATREESAANCGRGSGEPIRRPPQACPQQF